MNIKEAFIAASEFEDDEWDYLDTYKVAKWPRFNESTLPPEGNMYNEPNMLAWLAELGEEGELVGTENFEIITFTDEEIVICCGGDWQPPSLITLRMVSDALTVVDTILFANYQEGITREEIIESLS